MLDSFLERLTDRARSEWRVVHHERIPEEPPRYEDVPGEVDPRITRLIYRAGIGSLYSHQAEAIRHSLQGRNVVLATSTASGKTLAYQVPVMHRLIQDPAATALFLFPLKALERDQRDAFLALAGDSGVTAEVYDGDTPESVRRKIKLNPPRVIITNPDMLHLGLLAFHDSWKDFFANLSYIVLDEVHTYKGIFGSHISQVLLRVRRVCNEYGAQPRFFASSATIANPGTFVSRLIGQDTVVVDRSGASVSPRHFLFLSPQLSPYTVASRLFREGIQSGLKTICFTRARKITELITMWVIAEEPRLRSRISSYRAGFLPEERREIEARLFSGEMDGVISTSALEMGIDVGGLDLCILVGYPGTIINTWQRGGRVGRAGRPSAIVLIAGHDALDQYFLKHPDDFFGRSCEEAVIDPYNREVLKRHLQCAAAEVPIRSTEEWTHEPNVNAVLEELVEDGTLFVHPQTKAWHSLRRKPHREVDLRGIGESYSIFLEDGKRMIGSTSGMRAFSECHEGAVYLHRTRQYVVTQLDLSRRNVFVKPAKVNYYTRGLSEKDTEILGAPTASTDFPGFTVRLGRLKVTERVHSYEKRRSSGQELIGVVELELPALHFETVGLWIEIPDRVKELVEKSGLHFMGGIHALEHAAISMFPLFALCDRDDVGGISTPLHEQVCRAAIFIYDGHPGGVGLAVHMFDHITKLLEKTRSLVQECGCEDGCPSCIHSPKCGSGNNPLDKQAALAVVRYLLEPGKDHLSILKPRQPWPEPRPITEAEPSAPKTKRRRKSVIFPDLNITATSEPQSGLSSAVKMVSARTPQRIAVFDLETRKLADEVGGWKNISKMGLALGVVYCEPDGYRTFTEETVQELIALLKSADLVVGFNQMRFDYEVLRAYSKENLRARPNVDILVDVSKVLGFRLTLEHLAHHTLGKGKSGHGLEAVKWFREGRMDLLEQYCRDDVAITWELYNFGKKNGHLVFKTKRGALGRVPVDWP
ncbi:MAG: DEAD/DEAH box helicase [Desulfomonile sp.]|nr:DEAD/DEAH box helicase [Desulfomonile sp.]